MPIFGTNSLKKLQNILKKVDDKDIHDYFRFERMKQGYSAEGRRGVEKLYPFFFERYHFEQKHS